MTRQASRAPALGPRRRPIRIPLSPNQERLWFLQRLQPYGRAYHMTRAWRLRGGHVDAGRLGQALNAVVARHEALRTTFPLADGSPVQVVGPPGSIRLETMDRRARSDDARAEAVREACAATNDPPFDLTTGPLLRARLLRTAPDDQVLLLCMHHIISDGWSMRLFANELTAIYTALARGGMADLPALDVQYADYALWLLERRDEDAEALAAVTHRLAGVRALTSLPADRARRVVQGPRGARAPIALGRDLTAACTALGRVHGVTPFMALLAALDVLLLRLGGEPDICVGAPIWNRPHAALEPLIGFFANTVALRTDLDGDPTFETVLARVRETALEAYAHPGIPFARVVEAANPVRDPGHQPLFQIMLAYLGGPRPKLGLPGVSVEPLRISPGTSQRDLSISLRPARGGLAGSIEYDTDLFDAETIARVWGQFTTLVEGVVARPDARVSTLSLLRANERRAVLAAGAGPPAAKEPVRPVHERIAALAVAAPEAVALVDPGDGSARPARVLTRGALRERARVLAHRLRVRGVGPGATVALFLERSPDFVVAMLAVLEAGGAYLPLDVAAPPSRASGMIRDAGCALVLTGQGLAGRLGPDPAKLLLLDTARGPEDAPAGDAAQPGIAASPDDLAYVIYTSGSSGRPKGVEITRAALAHASETLGDAYGLAGEDRVLQFAALDFDTAAEEVFPTLTRGATCVLRRTADGASVEALLETCAGQRITVLDLPTAFWHVLVDVLAERDLTLPESIRLVIIGGERARPENVARWHARVTGEVRLVNSYGPTEATIVTTLCDLTALHATGAAPPETPIGKPLPGTCVLVLDEQGAPVPHGAPGELYIGGAGLARGYVGDPALTAASFPSIPVAADRGARFYRSGDVVRFWTNGDLLFLGRRDRQVKVRGHRVELAEIEAAMRESPEVSDAAVIAASHATGDPRLLGFVAAGGIGVDARGLAAHLRARLPAYMQPASLCVLDALPRTASGKVDRKALARLPEPAHERNATTTAPRGATERRLGEIWTALLGVSPIGIRDDFFALGGHSLLAVRLFASIETRFERRLPLATLFERPTIEGLAEAIESGAAPAPVVPIQPRGNRPPLFLIPPIEGEVLCYRELSRRLGEEQPVFGLRAPGSDVDPMDMEAVASHYAQALDGAAGTADYCLGGFSYGGVVAFEVARRCRDRGRGPVHLLLIDARAPPARGGGLEQHRTPAYDAAVTLFRATERPPGSARAADLGWSARCTGNFEIVAAPGTHHAVLTGASAGRIAEHISALECLAATGGRR